MVIRVWAVVVPPAPTSAKLAVSVGKLMPGVVDERTPVMPVAPAPVVSCRAGSRSTVSPDSANVLPLPALLPEPSSIGPGSVSAR